MQRYGPFSPMLMSDKTYISAAIMAPYALASLHRLAVLRVGERGARGGGRPARVGGGGTEPVAPNPAQIGATQPPKD